MHFGIVDVPDRERKLHTRPIPRVGGIAVLLAYSAAFLVLLLLPLSGGTIVGGHLPIVRRLLLPVALIFLTGLVDDLVGLKPWQKLAGQVAAAVWVFSEGVRIGSVSGWAVNHWGSAILTIIWLVACSNAINLIDALDGLASGVDCLAPQPSSSPRSSRATSSSHS